MNWHSVVSLLAAPEQNPVPAPPGLDFAMILPFAAIAVIFYFLLFRPQKREQAAREAMIKALKKNDKVVTIGGIIGTVANISSDGEEVTLKVDDNTRIRITRTSIQRVVSAEASADPSTEAG
ncbi:MAG: preprotein translocase subunit YajC [Planctomycetaceae bacterium]|nr:preprotein translocase subunit YajC [Planctomycetaceae bacterium]